MFTREEIQILAEGLDSLARNSKDVIATAMRLSSIRAKLEDLSRDIANQQTKDANADRSDTQ